MEAERQPVVVGISGRICVGKTTLARALAAHVRGARFSTRDVLADCVRSCDRLVLQDAGATLDRETAGAWVADSLEPRVRLSEVPLVVVDAVRILEQLEHLRRRWPVVHVHLVAARDVLEARYAMRQSEHPDVEAASYEIVAADPTESRVDALAQQAEVVVDTSATPVSEVVRAIGRTSGSAATPGLAALALLLRAS